MKGVVTVKEHSVCGFCGVSCPAMDYFMAISFPQSHLISRKIAGLNS